MTARINPESGFAPVELRGLTPQAFDRVVSTYRAVLDRDPDPQGLVTHLRMLDADPSGVSIIRNLLSSPEFQNNVTRLGEYNCFDFKLLVPSDDWMLVSIREDGVYEPYVVEAFRESCANARVLDVGANIGVFSMVAAGVTKKKITAVEASAHSAKLIEANAHINSFNNIEVLPVAAAEHLGMARFPRTRDSNKVMLNETISRDNVELIDVALAAPLDMLVNDRIDVMKIDVEGREYQALLGARRILEMKPKVFLEFSPDFAEFGSGVDAKVLLDFLFQRGYEATILHRDMTRESVKRNAGRLINVWNDYMSRSITHLDLMMVAPD